MISMEIRMIGVAIFKIEKDIFQVLQIILSCRSFSRDVEKLIIYYVLKNWQDSKIEHIKFLFDTDIESDNYGLKFMFNNKLKINQELKKDQIPIELFNIPNHINLVKQ